MSIGLKQNALLIQHCYNQFGTTQFKKTVKNWQKGPVLASKYPFGAPEGLRVPQGARFGPNCHRLVKLMITTYIGLVWVSSGPPGDNFVTT